jgi:hypothetical protein
MSYAIFQEDKSIASSACVEKGNRKTSTITINVGADMCSKAPIQLSTRMRGGTAAGLAARRGKETNSSRSSGSSGGSGSSGSSGGSGGSGGRRGGGGGGSGSSGRSSGGSNSSGGGGSNSSRGETKTKTGGGRFLKSKRTSNFVGKSNKAKAAPPVAPSRNKKGPPPKVAKRKERVKAMYAYIASDSDELSMKGKVLCVACVLRVGRR